ncbi:TetR/AcrR family transcriptional regulator [Kineosporia sp. A_224]|uniref:TetR/AcrR family transcriptional regulator n=1 Tax=Kineosporia sp. A_224 TaxID=1962180 RepID=UPI000B4B4E97|nr:TetR/AcrR family transcriptional regulator [Kineosporia sp. A_224]
MAGSSVSRRRLARGSLSRQVIVEAALGLLDEEGPDALTFARLGSALDASTTAVYRHFTSRDEIVVALAEELDRLSLHGYEAHEDWRESLRDLAWRAWRTASEHPAAASTAMHRTTRGIHELRAVDAVLEALHRAGLRGEDAGTSYAVYAHLVLAVCSQHATRLVSMSAEGVEGWVQVYHPTDPTAYPYAARAAAYLSAIDHTEVFRRQVELVITDLETRASRAGV